MSSHPIRRANILVSAALLASLAVATTTASVSAGKPKCFGRTATIVGTAKGEVIVGTKKADVIVARGGHDKVYGRGGNDIVCGNKGNDRIWGGPNSDTIFGGTGHDTLSGQTGPDRLLGGPGDDAFDGGIGVDLCAQGTGSGPRVNCERPPVVVAPPPPPPPKVLAIAYSDLNGNHAFDAGDVLISRLVDTSRDGAPGPGDTVEMGMYPMDLAASTFGEWLAKTHAVASIASQDATHVQLLSTGGGTHIWYRGATHAIYSERAGANASGFQDSLVTTLYPDSVRVDAGSPSAPQTAVPSTSLFRANDNHFLDVELNH